MIDNKHMQSLIDAPLANAIKVNLPGGKLAARRSPKPEYGDEIGCPKVSAKELKERKRKAEEAKRSDLYDYYAATDLTPKRVAEHMGIYRQEQTGTDDQGKPVFARVLDVKTVEAQLAWRRKSAA
jgi:hypothetical protein